MKCAACEVPPMRGMCGAIYTLYAVIGYPTMYVERREHQHRHEDGQQQTRCNMSFLALSHFKGRR